VEGQTVGVTMKQAERERAEQALEAEAMRERARQLAEMNAALVEQARAQKDQVITGFLRDIMSQVRTLVYETTTDVLAALQGAQTLPAQQARRLNRLIGDLKRLNFTDDPDLTQILERVQEMTEGKERPDVGSIRAQLRTIAVVTRSQLLDLGEPLRECKPGNKMAAFWKNKVAVVCHEVACFLACMRIERKHGWKHNLAVIALLLATSRMGKENSGTPATICFHSVLLRWIDSEMNLCLNYVSTSVFALSHLILHEVEA
jgi:hypothetical protein